VQAGPLRGKIYGNQGSGEAGTAAKNKIGGFTVMRYACGQAMEGVDPVTILDDGDDLMLDVPPRYATRAIFRSWQRRLANLGLECKFEVVATDTEENRAEWGLRFCRAGLIHTSRGPYMCKDPIDALRTLTNYRRHFTPKELPNYLQTLSVGMQSLFGDVPVLGAVVDMLDVQADVDWSLMGDTGLEKHILRHRKHVPGLITEETRKSFFLTFGITPTEQINCENLLRGVRPLLCAALRNYVEDHG